MADVDLIRERVEQSIAVKRALLSDELLGLTARFADALTESLAGGGTIIFCGNGGSAADSEHIAAELLKGMVAQRPLPDAERQRFLAAFPEDGSYLADNLQGALPAISLASHTSLLTAYANDIAADMAFAQQVYAYGRAGDALLALSTSGGSPNVLHALRVARALGLRTVGLTGAAGGAMLDLCDACVRVPCRDTADVQERHLPIYHVLCVMLEREFFGEDER